MKAEILLNGVSPSSREMIAARALRASKASGPHRESYVKPEGCEAWRNRVAKGPHATA
jgi:hypothetical protein